MLLLWNTLQLWHIDSSEYDCFWKVVWLSCFCNSLLVGTFKWSDPDTISEKDLEVDIVKAWSDLGRSLIAEGLIPSLDLLVL